MYRQYLSDWYRYSRFPSVESLRFIDSYPCIYDRIKTTPFDAHYFCQSVWAFREIRESGVKSHVEVGSETRWVGLFSIVTKVTFIDIRPFEMDSTDLIMKGGSILNMLFRENSVNSLSCLPLNPEVSEGDVKYICKVVEEYRQNKE